MRDAGKKKLRTLQLSPASTSPSINIMNDVFETCRLDNATEEDGMEAALHCVANTLSTNTETAYAHFTSLSTAVDIFFLLFASIVMFTMQAGFAMLCAGSVRRKNVQNTLLKNFLDACGGGVAFFVCGRYNEDAGWKSSFTETILTISMNLFVFSFFIYCRICLCLWRHERRDITRRNGRHISDYVCWS